MPSINMIAVRRQEKRRQEQNTRKLLYSILAEIGLIVIVVITFTTRIFVTTGHIADLNERLHSLQPRVIQIQQLESQTTALMPKVDTLDGAKADTLFWYSNLFAVTDSLPPKTWLTSIGTGSGVAGQTGDMKPGAVSGTDPTLSLAGVAMSQATVGETMLRMNQAPSLDHVDLAFVQQQKIGLADAVSFQMTVHLKPEASAVTATDAKGASSGTKS